MIICSEPSSPTSRSLPIDLPLPLKRSGTNFPLELAWYFAQAHMVQEGPIGETLALQVGPMGKFVAKHGILL
jgi:hypothetical protein